MTVISLPRTFSPTASTLPATVHYDRLTLVQQNAFDDALAAAHAAPNHAAYYRHCADAAEAAGARLPHHGEIDRCTCDCDCDLIFDGQQRAEYHPGGDADPIVQCPDCQDDHRLTDEA